MVVRRGRAAGGPPGGRHEASPPLRRESRASFLGPRRMRNHLVVSVARDLVVDSRIKLLDCTSSDQVGHFGAVA